MLITIIFLLVIFFIFKFNQKKPEVVPATLSTSAFEKVMQRHKLLDHHFDDALLESIRLAMTNEVFDFSEVKSKPQLPTFKYLPLIHQNFQDNLDGGISADAIATDLLGKLEPQHMNDFVINEINQKVLSYAEASQAYERSRDFCTNFLLEIGLISEEEFSVDGKNILAYRTILNDSISFKHAGTGIEMKNPKFSFADNTQIRGYNEVSYFEQLIIKILRENALYLELKKDEMINAFHVLKTPSTLPNNKHEEEVKFVHRIYFVLNEKIKHATAIDTPKPDFASITCNTHISEWTATKESLNHLIALYHKLLKACESSDDGEMASILCHFERENFLLSADTIMLTTAISNNNTELLARLDDLGADFSSQIDDLSGDLNSQIQSVKNTAQAATAAATTAAIQATRVHNKMK